MMATEEEQWVASPNSPATAHGRSSLMRAMRRKDEPLEANRTVQLLIRNPPTLRGRPTTVLALNPPYIRLGAIRFFRRTQG